MLREIKTLIQKLNPKARVIAPRKDFYADLDVRKELLHTQLFDMDEASRSAGWMLELEKEEHAPETEEYGISSTIFRANNMPFHPERLSAVLHGFGDYGSALLHPTVLAQQATPTRRCGRRAARAVGTHRRSVPWRSAMQGQLWLANAVLSQCRFTAGRHLTVITTDEPFSCSRQRRLGRHNEGRQEPVQDGRWDKTFGDRRSEIACIGVNLNVPLIAKKLREALLTVKVRHCGVEGGENCMTVPWSAENFRVRMSPCGKL